jgi:outer membrane lipoprotein-sorting protein
MIKKKNISRPINKIHMLTKTLQVSCLFLFLLSPCSWAETPQNSVPVEKRQLFTRIADAASRVKTISGKFMQERKTGLLNEILMSKGRFYFEPPQRFLWETTEPSVSGFAMEGKKVKQWKGNSDNAQVIDVDQAPGLKAFAEQVFLWMNADFDKLEQMYRIEILREVPATIKLAPLGDAGSEALAYLTIVFSKDFSHVTTVEIHEKDGDFTKISFSNALINGPVLKKLF